MIDFAIHDAAGNIIQTGRTDKLASAEALALRKGAELYLGVVDTATQIIVDSEPVAKPDRPATDALKAELKAEIDLQAGLVRGLFITTAPGQEIVYSEKRAEAERVLAGATENVPHIAAEAAANGVTLLEQAQTVLAMASAWVSLSVAIESRRLAAKAAVDAAATESAACAFGKVDWSDIRAMAQKKDRGLCGDRGGSDEFRD